MADGDRAGLALFRFEAGWIGIAKTGDRTTISMVNNIAMDLTDGWTTFYNGTEIASQEISGAPFGCAFKLTSRLARIRKDTFLAALMELSLSILARPMSNPTNIFSSWAIDMGCLILRLLSLGARLLSRALTLVSERVGIRRFDHYFLDASCPSMNLNNFCFSGFTAVYMAV
ncbi:hypothetical protein EDB80DRAFT_99841 [Ilyonectria destructans]|nr:hypothetical protein EDB80DRAFT_99841 [Ilyonectria destructans]